MANNGRNHSTIKRMTAARDALLANPTGMAIAHLRSIVGCSRDELSTALKNLRDDGVVENPLRGYWRILQTPAPVVEPLALQPALTDDLGDVRPLLARRESLAAELAQRDATLAKMAEEMHRRDAVAAHIRRIDAAMAALGVTL